MKSLHVEMSPSWRSGTFPQLSKAGQLKQTLGVGLSWQLI